MTGTARGVSTLTIFCLIGSGYGSAQVTKKIPTVRIDATPGHEVNAFDPDQAIGSSMDNLPYGAIDKIYSPAIIKQCLSAGYGPITYRNNTELRMAAWHWNENGAWSDAAHKSGYFTGSTELKESIRYIRSYSLPHRGFTRSGGGASATLQGSGVTYWKSNPYPTSKFTGEDDALHPQWVVMDLGAANPVSAIRIAWANPYAKSYEVAYWLGQDPLSKNPEGQWKAFPSGTVRNGQGGTVTLSLAESPTPIRYIRVWMMESSNSCDEHGEDDVRNCVGYAIQEITAGSLDANGGFVDLAGDASNQKRPTFVTSSIDPWHAEAGLAARGSQHTGFDLFFTSGITNNLPAMIPVTMLYGTPDDAAAQIEYIKKRGYPIGWVEMGEEPDGKNILPEDYGALYLQWATAIHKVDPALKLGGPIFEGVNEDIKVWPDAEGKTSWMGRFVDYLKAHGRLSDLAFVSFEHYPFEPCEITWKDLYREPRLMSHILQVWREDGVPKEVPLMVTESNLSWRLSGPMSTIFSALWLADSIGSFFETGGAAYFHSPIQPEPVQNTCQGWATWGNFVCDGNFNVRGYTATYFAARLINREWAQHRAGIHQMFPTTSAIKDDAGNMLVTAYALHRPDGNWALMLVNRDESSPHSVRVVFEDSSRKAQESFSGPVTMVTFGSKQYVWISDGPSSHADPDGPPATSTINADAQTSYELPKASIMVIRGKLNAR
jgi:F5/8 type C domain